MAHHRLLEHTADMGLEASAATPEELFAEAARALREIISAEASGAGETRTVELTGADRGELLVAWLNEILFLFEVRDFFPADFAVLEAGEGRLRAVVRGERFDPERHPIEREVKAVTYHRLTVEEEGGRWHARVFVDL